MADFKGDAHAAAAKRTVTLQPVAQPPEAAVRAGKAAGDNRKADVAAGAKQAQAGGSSGAAGGAGATAGRGGGQGGGSGGTGAPVDAGDTHARAAVLGDRALLRAADLRGRLRDVAE